MKNSQLTNASGAESLKWVEEVDLSGNPLSSLAFMRNSCQWRGPLALLDLSDTRVPVGELAVLAELSCEIDTIDISGTPADSSWKENARPVGEIFEGCRNVHFVKFQNAVVSVDELRL